MTPHCERIPEATYVARADATSIQVTLANRDGAPVSAPAALTAVCTEGRELVAGLIVGTDGLTLTPAGRPGRVGLQLRVPSVHGTREIRFSVCLVQDDDPRVGIGQVTIT